LVRYAADDHALVLITHHLITDGYSEQLIASEFAQVYDALARGTAAALPEVTARFGDLTTWQRARASDPLVARQRSYWRQVLADPPAPLELSTGGRREATRSRRAQSAGHG